MGKMQKRVTAIILAAGDGRRMGLSEKKQFLMLSGIPVIRRAVEAFVSCEAVSDIVIVTAEEDVRRTRELLLGLDEKPVNIVAGGKTRAESARLGFLAAPLDTDFVAFHDGARPLISAADIAAVISAAAEFGAATAGRAVTDTVKRMNKDGVISETLPRTELFLAATPQVFSRELYAASLLCDTESDTDDNMQIERIGGKIRCVETDSENIKITTATDLEYAEYLIGRKKDV